MKYTIFLKNRHILFTILLILLLFIFLIIKWNCEKLHQDIFHYSDNKTTYLVNSKIKKNNLYLTVIGPISKGNFSTHEITVEIKDKDGVILGQTNVKNVDIFNQKNEHIRFNAIIPNISWKDRLSSFDINITLPFKYYSPYYINNDMSNIELYHRNYENIPILDLIDMIEIDNILTKVSKNEEIHDPFDLAEKIAKYDKGRILANHVFLNDKEEIVVDFKSHTMTQGEIHNLAFTLRNK